ncbi:MAG: NAD-binding protein [Magnetococcales bacterium]|nr:NAD-binding protein [Magnetococcales bacterium]
MMIKPSTYQQFKGIFRTLFAGADDSGRKVLNIFMMLLVISSIGVMILDTNPDLTQSEIEYFQLLDETFTWIFLTEYLLRFWVCSDLRYDFDRAFNRYQRRRLKPTKALTIFHAIKVATSNKIKWMVQPLSIVDLLAILPFFRMFRLFRVFRVFRLLKLFRYSKRLVFFVEIIKERSYELIALFTVAVVIWGMIAIAFYIVEVGVNPQVSNIWEAVYWAIITITTVGYGDITPVTPIGQGVAVIGTLTGMWVIVFMTSIIVSTLTERIVSLRGFKMINKIERMDKHTIICGLDTLGRAVCQSLEKEGRTFVGVDIDQDRVDQAEKRGWVAIQGDTTQEEVWQKLNLKCAHSIVSTFIDEVSNVYVILLVKEKNPKCLIIVTGESKTSEKRLIKVGADKVVSPYLLGGAQLAHNAIRPNAVQLIDLALKKEHKDLNLEELRVPTKSRLDGIALADTVIRSQFNIIIVGITRQDREMIFNPSAATVVKNGDSLICMGHDDDLKRFQQYMQNDSA